MEGADLTVGSLRRHLWNISFPASLGYLFSTMYNVVDTWFASEISEAALAALGFSFPAFFLFLITLHAGFSVGVGAVVSHALGAGDRAEARRLTAQGVFLSLVGSAAIMAIGFLISPWLFGTVLKARDEALDQALAYMNPIYLGGVPLVVAFAMNGALQASGDTVTIRNVAIASFFLNIGLNWLLIPHFGIAGIAWATTIIQFLNLAYIGYRLGKARLFTRACWRQLRPSWNVTCDVLGQSVPATLNMVTIGFGILIITRFIGHYGETTVASYLAATRIEQLVLLPCIGMNSAVLAITGQNAGAFKISRARKTLHLGLRYGAVIMVVGGVLVWVFARPLMRAFQPAGDAAEFVQIGVTYLRITVFLFLGYMVLFMTVAFLQGLKKPVFAVAIGLYRQIAMPLLAMSLVVLVWEKEAVWVWWTVFAINWSAAIVSYLYAVWAGRRMQSAHHGAMRPQSVSL